LVVEQAKDALVQAETAVAQAASSVSVAQTAVTQAEANLKILELQVKKLTVITPSDGVVLSSTVEEGELVQPGITVMVIGNLDKLKITVYLAEDVYGQIGLGDRAEVRVDSYPDEVFEAEVVKIADQAEYTPRNVQTEEDRRTTVFAIELAVLGHDGNLKPGMPADVSFLQ
jgi:multidrug resistance efflux pump